MKVMARLALLRTVHWCLTQSLQKLLAENFLLKASVDPQNSICPLASTPPLVWYSGSVQ